MTFYSHLVTTAWSHLVFQTLRTYAFWPQVCFGHLVVMWHSGNGIEHISEVTLRRARLVPGWVTTFGQANHLDMQSTTQVNSASYPTRDGK